MYTHSYEADNDKMAHLMMDLLLGERHQDDRYEEVQNHEGHEDDAGAYQEAAEQWVVIQNLGKSNGMKLSAHHQYTATVIECVEGGYQVSR